MAKRILVPIDFSDVTDILMEKTLELAQAFKATVCLLHVEHTPDHVSFSQGPEYEKDSGAREAVGDYHHLNDLKHQLNSRGLEVKSVVLQGDRVKKILQEARQYEADLIVIGSHGHGALYHLLLGSVCEGVLRGAHCPVMIVPSQRS